MNRTAFTHRPPFIPSLLLVVSAVFCLVAVAQAQQAEVSPELQAKLEGPLTLDDCIEIALAKNRLLSAAELEREAVDKEVGAAVGTWMPEFGLSALRTNIHGDTEGLGSLAPGDFAEATATDLVASVTQRLPLGGDMELRYDFSKSGSDLVGGYGGSVLLRQPLLRDAGWRRATADVKDSRLAASAEQALLQARSLEVLFQVKSAYFEVLRRRELIQVNQQAIERDQQLLAFSQAKVDAQLATRRDVLSAEIILAQDRSRLVNAETGYMGALDDLANWLGVGFEDTLHVVSMPLELQPIGIEQERWIERALRDNPDVQSAAFDLQRSELAEDVAAKGRLPRLDLTLLYGQTYEGIASTDSFRSTRRGERTLQGGVEIAVPFLNMTPANLHRAAKLRTRRGEELLDEAKRQVVLAVRDAARNLDRIEERISVLDKEIQGAKDKVEFANVNFQLGRASNLDITDAQKDLVNAQSDYVDEVVNYRVELARLERLLGGTLP